MRKSQPAAYPWCRVKRVTTAEACFFICMIGLMTAGAAFAQNARVPGTASSYVVDGLALGARVDPESPAYRGYQCSPSELFPDFTRCQRTQKQQEGGTRRSFEATSSTLHGRDGKAVYINRHIAPWSFDRNEIQDAIKQLSSKFGERAREMRLPPREGVQTAIIAVWGKIQLTELDADAVSILASGESPRKGLLIDYLGNLRRSAQLGLPVYSLNGGAGYIWSASVDRNNRGHIRFLTVDPSALSPAPLHPRQQQHSLRQAKSRRPKPQRSPTWMLNRRLWSLRRQALMPGSPKLTLRIRQLWKETKLPFCSLGLKGI